MEEEAETVHHLKMQHSLAIHVSVYLTQFISLSENSELGLLQMCKNWH